MGESVNVAMVETGGWGGIGHYTHCLCSAVVEIGVDVTLLTHADRYQLDAFPKSYRHRNIFKGDGFFSDWQRLAAELKELRPDIVHFQSLLSSRRDWIFFLLHRRFYHKPKTVFTVHNVLPHEIVRGERFAYKMLYRQASGLILHSNASLNKLSALLHGKPSTPHAVIPHGHYGDLVETGNTSRSESLAMIGLAEGSYIVFFGAIRPYKGLEQLLRAIASLDQWPPDMKLLVVGQPMHGVTADEINAWVRQLGIADRVILRLDYVSERMIPAVFNIADLIVLPYLEIDHSGVLMAAMAAGKPVLCTSVGAFPEVVRPEFGFLAPEPPADTLADTLRLAIGERGQWGAMGQKAKKAAEVHFAWSGIAQQTVAFYRRVNPDTTDGERSRQGH